MSTLETGLRDRAAQASADAVAAYEADAAEQERLDRDRDARKMRTAAAQQLGEQIMAGGVEYDDDNLRLLLPDGITLQYRSQAWTPSNAFTGDDFLLCEVCPKCEEWYSGTTPIGGKILTDDQKLASLGAALEQGLPPHNCDDEEIDVPAAPAPVTAPTLREQAMSALDDAESALDDDPARATALATIAVAKALGEIHDALVSSGGQR